MVERASRAISLGLPKVPPLDEDDLASPSNVKGNPFSIFPLPVRSRRRKDVPTRCCDPCFRSPNELLKAMFSGALAMLWKTSCFRR